MDDNDKINELKAQIKAAEAAETVETVETVETAETVETVETAETVEAAETVEPAAPAETAVKKTQDKIKNAHIKKATLNYCKKIYAEYYKKTQNVIRATNPLYQMTNTHTIAQTSPMKSLLASPLAKSAVTKTSDAIRAGQRAACKQAIKTKTGIIVNTNVNIHRPITHNHHSTYDPIPSSGIISLWNTSNIVCQPLPPLPKHECPQPLLCDLFRDKMAFDALLTANVIIEGYEKGEASKSVDLWFAKFEYDAKKEYPVPSVDATTLDAIKGWYAKCGVEFEVSKTDVKVPTSAKEAIAYMDGQHGMAGAQIPMFVGYMPELIEYEKQKQLIVDASTALCKCGSGAYKNGTALKYTDLISIHDAAFKLNDKNKLYKVIEKQLLAAITRVDEEYDTVFVSMMDYETDAKQMTTLIKKIKSCHPALFETLAAKFDNIYDAEFEMMQCGTQYTLYICPAIERRFKKIMNVYEQIAKYDMEIVKRHKMDLILSAVVDDCAACWTDTQPTRPTQPLFQPETTRGKINPWVDTIFMPETTREKVDMIGRSEDLFCNGFAKVDGIVIDTTKLNNSPFSPRPLPKDDETDSKSTFCYMSSGDIECKTDKKWESAWSNNKPYSSNDNHNEHSDGNGDDLHPFASLLSGEIGTYSNGLDDSTYLKPAEYPSVFESLNRNNYPTFYDNLTVGGKYSEYYPHLVPESCHKIIKAAPDADQVVAMHMVLINPITMHTVVDEIAIPMGDFKAFAMTDTRKFNAPEYGFKKLFFYISKKSSKQEIGDAIKTQFDGVCHYSVTEINKGIESIVNVIDMCNTRANIAILRNDSSDFMHNDSEIKRYIQRAFGKDALAYNMCKTNSNTVLSAYYNGPFEKVALDVSGEETHKVEYIVKLVDVIENGVDSMGSKLSRNYALKARFEEHLKSVGWEVSGIGAAKVFKCVMDVSGAGETTVDLDINDEHTNEYKRKLNEIRVVKVPSFATGLASISERSAS